MAAPSDTGVSSMERHFQSLALALITAAALFMASFVVGAREEAAAQKEWRVSMSQQMGALQTQLAALQASYVTREEWRDHEVRIRAVEQYERESEKRRGK